jgi:hypothetical protein
MKQFKRRAGNGRHHGKSAAASPPSAWPIEGLQAEAASAALVKRDKMVKAFGLVVQMSFSVGGCGGKRRHRPRR